MAASTKPITVKIIGDNTSFDVAISKSQLKMIEMRGSLDSLSRTLSVQSQEAKKFAKSLQDVGNAGHGAVSGMQASSASLRLLENGFGNNIRAAERFIGTIPGLSNLLKATFPIVGGIALIGDIHRDVRSRGEAKESF